MASILTYIYGATDYEKYLKDKYSQDWKSRWENLGELLSIAKKAHEATVELHEYEQSREKSDKDDSTFGEPTDVEPVDDEPADADISDEDSELLDLTSDGPA